MYFVISIKSISNLVCLSVDPLTVEAFQSHSSQGNFVARELLEIRFIDKVR